MQYGSLIRAKRRRGADIWEHRWREPGPDRSRRHRRIVVGSVDQYEQRQNPLRAIAALQRDINQTGTGQRNRAITVQELFDHYRQRELDDGNTTKTSATKNTYKGYITKSVFPPAGTRDLTTDRGRPACLDIRQPATRSQLPGRMTGGCRASQDS